MNHERKLLVWTWIVLFVLAAGGIGYHYHTVRQLQSSIGTLRAELQQNAQNLHEQVQNARILFEERISTLDERINTSADSLREDIAESEQRSMLKLITVEGKLLQVEQQSRSLEEKIVDLDIKSQDFSMIVERTLQSVVSVFTDRGGGSGAIVDERGYIVTNFHVVKDARQIVVRTYRGDTYPIRVVAADATRDLALLKMDTVRKFNALAFEPSGNTKVGTKVIALGSPAGLEFSVTEGIVSALGRESSAGVRVVQTDVPINPGSSGGPLVNIRGNIVGINTYKTKGFESLGFAIDSDEAEDFVVDGIAGDAPE